MPYILAVLLLVIASVGFTFFKVSDITVAASNSEPIAGESIAFDATPSNSPPQIASSSEIASTTLESSTGHPSPLPTSTPTPQPPASSILTPTPKPTPPPIVVYQYRKGTYSTQNSYRTPGGTYTINVSTTISNDKVTSSLVSFSVGSDDGYSKRFSNAYQSTVIGLDLGTVHPARIGGASLTTRAFNSALDTIRSQAAT